MAFKMKPFSGFGNSPMKQKGFIRTPEGFDHEASKKLAKQEFKRNAAKSGHGTIKDLKAKTKMVKQTAKGLETQAKTRMVKQVAKKGLGALARRSLGPAGIALTAYDIAKTAKKAIRGLKRRAKSGNVNIGRKI